MTTLYCLILILFATIILGITGISNANALSQSECNTITNLSSIVLGYTVVTCDNPFNVVVNMGQRLQIQNPNGGSANMLPSASYGSIGTYQYSSGSTSGTIKLQNPPDIGISFQNVQVSFSGSQMSVSGNIVNSNNFPVTDLYVYWHVTDSSGKYLTSWQRFGNDGQAYNTPIASQSTGSFSETVCCLPASEATTATPYLVQAFRDDGTRLVSINEPPPTPIDGSFVLPCSMQEKGDGVSTSSCNGSYESGIAIAKVGISYNSGLFPIKNYKAVGFFIDKNGNQGQNIPITLDQINPKESKVLVFKNTISGFVKEFKMQMLGGELVTAPEPPKSTPVPQDGPFVLPCSMQEKGDGVSASSCYGFYQNSIARAEVGINYHSGLFPITNYKAVGYFIDKTGKQGPSITVTLDKINPGESKTLVFTNPTAGFVSQFKMQMLGGELVTAPEPPKSTPATLKIPAHVRDIARAWSEKQISDYEFLQNIQYLINTGSMVISDIPAGTGSKKEIPNWVRNNANWWASNLINDADFAGAIRGLFATGNLPVEVKGVPKPIQPQEETSIQETPMAISVFTDKSSYKFGDIITVKGKTQSSDTTVTIVIKNSQNKIMHTTQSKTNNDGTFLQSFSSNSPLYDKSGKYVVQAKQGSQYTETTFQFTASKTLTCKENHELVNGKCIDKEPLSPSISDSETQEEPLELIISSVVKNKINALTIKNSEDSVDDVYGIKFKVDGKISKFSKLKDWKIQRIDKSSVMYTTKKYPLEPDDTIKIRLEIDSKKAEIQWEAFSEDKESLGTGIIKTKTEKTTQKENSQTTSTQKSTSNEPITVRTDKSYYDEGSTIVISGKVRSVLLDTPLSLHVFYGETLVQMDQVVVAQDGTFTTTLIAKGPQWSKEGTYLVRAVYSGNMAETSFKFKPVETGVTITNFFEVNAGKFGTFDVPYTINGGTIKNMQLEQKILGLVVTIEAQGDGIITLELPRSFIDAKKSDGKDERFLVLIDGSEIVFEETASTRDYRTLKFGFKKGDSKIEIIGNKIKN